MADPLYPGSEYTNPLIFGAGMQSIGQASMQGAQLMLQARRQRADEEWRMAALERQQREEERLNRDRLAALDSGGLGGGGGPDSPAERQAMADLGIVQQSEAELAARGQAEFEARASAEAELALREELTAAPYLRGRGEQEMLEAGGSAAAARTAGSFGRYGADPLTAEYAMQQRGIPNAERDYVLDVLSGAQPPPTVPRGVARGEGQFDPMRTTVPTAEGLANPWAEFMGPGYVGTAAEARERQGQGLASPAPDAASEYVARMGLVQDREDRRVAQEAAEEQQRRYQAEIEQRTEIAAAVVPALPEFKKLTPEAHAALARWYATDPDGFEAVHGQAADTLQSQIAAGPGQARVRETRESRTARSEAATLRITQQAQERWDAAQVRLNEASDAQDALFRQLESATDPVQQVALSERVDQLDREMFAAVAEERAARQDAADAGVIGAGVGASPVASGKVLPRLVDGDDAPKSAYDITPEQVVTLANKLETESGLSPEDADAVAAEMARVDPKRAIARLTARQPATADELVTLLSTLGRGQARVVGEDAGVQPQEVSTQAEVDALEKETEFVWVAKDGTKTTMMKK